jgi:hypothetical protein
VFQDARFFSRQYAPVGVEIRFIAGEIYRRRLVSDKTLRWKMDLK